MKAIDTICTIALAGSLIMGVSLNAIAAAPAPVKPLTIDVATHDFKAFKLDGQDSSYIQESLNRVSPNKRASKWALLMDGEVVTIDGQLAVIWTRFDGSTGNHYLMVTNFGNLPISEELSLYYLDDMGKDFPEIQVQPGETGYAQVTVHNYGGTDEFALYDADGDFLAQLGWGSRIVVYYYPG